MRVCLSQAQAHKHTSKPLLSSHHPLPSFPRTHTYREFRLFVKAMTQTAIEVEVEIHFKGNDGTDYRNKRQLALLTIAEVVQRRSAKFAVLSSLLADGEAEEAARGMGATGVAAALGEASKDAPKKDNEEDES